jgi:drug/metabolite transporter (DMT)-like permease
MPFYVFAWIASTLYAVELIVGKLISKYQVSNAWLFNFFWSFFVLLLTFPVTIINHAGIPTHWLNLLLAAFFYAITGAGYLNALKKIDVSVISPLSSLRTVISIILGVVLLGESYSLIKVLLVGLVFIASLFVTIDEHLSVKTFFKKSNLWMIGVLVAISLMSIFINWSVKENGFWTVTLWMPLLAQIMLLPTIFLWKKDVRFLKKEHFGGMLTMAIFGATGSMAANKALSMNVGISTVIMVLPISMLFAIILSALTPTLLEKHTLKVYVIRLAAAAVMIAGTVGLTL